MASQQQYFQPPVKMGLKKKQSVKKMNISSPFNFQHNSKLAPVDNYTTSAPPIPLSLAYESQDKTRALSESMSNLTSHQPLGHPGHVSNRSLSSPNPLNLKDDHTTLLLAVRAFKKTSPNELTVEEGEILKLVQKSTVRDYVLVQYINKIGDPGWVPKDSVKVLEILSNNVSRGSSSSSSVSSFAANNIANKDSVSSFNSSVGSLNNYDFIGTKPPNSSYQQQLFTPPSTPPPPQEKFLQKTPISPFKENFTLHKSPTAGFVPPNSNSNSQNKRSKAFPFTDIRVRSTHRYDGRYWYKIDTVNEHRGCRLFLCRYYHDFYELHSKLIDICYEAQIKLPKLPSPMSVQDNKSDIPDLMRKRCFNLEVYLNQLIREVNYVEPGAEFSYKYLKMLAEWLKPKNNDFEIHRNSQLTEREIIERLQSGTGNRPMVIPPPIQQLPPHQKTPPQQQPPQLRHPHPYPHPIPFPPQMQQQQQQHHKKTSSQSIHFASQIPRSMANAVPPPQSPSSPFKKFHFQPGSPQQEQQQQQPPMRKQGPPQPLHKARSHKLMQQPLIRSPVEAVEPIQPLRLLQTQSEYSLPRPDSTTESLSDTLKSASLDDLPTQPLFAASATTPSQNYFDSSSSARLYSTYSSKTLDATASSTTLALNDEEKSPLTPTIPFSSVSPSTTTDEETQTIRCKVVRGEEIMMIKLPIDSSLHYLKLCILTNYVSGDPRQSIQMFDEISLSCKDIKGGSFTTLASNQHLRDYIDSCVSKGLHKVTIRVN